jgi:hypothetical protein
MKYRLTIVLIYLSAVYASKEPSQTKTKISPAMSGTLITTGALVGTIALLSGATAVRRNQKVKSRLKTEEQTAKKNNNGLSELNSTVDDKSKHQSFAKSDAFNEQSVALEKQVSEKLDKSLKSDNTAKMRAVIEGRRAARNAQMETEIEGKDNEVDEIWEKQKMRIWKIKCKQKKGRVYVTKSQLNKARIWNI